MGRHLAFWKYEDGVYLDNQKVYEEACCDEKIIDGLSTLPTDRILGRVSEVFADYDKLDERNYESSNGSFTVSTTEQSVLFDCGWSMLMTELNKIIDIMAEFDCPFYDPQIKTRFDGQ
ncbi:MAG: hypothetical protein J1E40_09550 [Oscillospiraceae bacterium]|nr:hypothetical protein [Oscillospiraceae bacterium]